MIRAVVLSLVLCASAYADVDRSSVYNFNDSPSNFENSQYNWSNSSLNWYNSPMNWENSQYNWNSNNGIYSNDGRREGYATTSPSGVRNIYDNDGKRRGYQPQEKQQ